jgi:hypothetical protein
MATRAETLVLCSEHSGTCSEIESLKSFQVRQEGTNGINQRLFDKLEHIAQKQTWILGGVAMLSFLIIVALTILGIFLKK